MELILVVMDVYIVQQYETFEDNRTPSGILELGDAEVARHFVR